MQTSSWQNIVDYLKRLGEIIQQWESCWPWPRLMSSDKLVRSGVTTIMLMLDTTILNKEQRTAIDTTYSIAAGFWYRTITTLKYDMPVRHLPNVKV